jgi:glucokinase
LENLATGPALVRKAKELLLKDSFQNDVLALCKDITPKQIFTAYEQSSEVADDVITEWIKNVGITLCNIASLLNPELIILGGGLTRSSVSILDKLKEILEWGTQVPPEIEISDLKEKASLLGGLRLCLDHYLMEYAAG